eukprot:54655-Eustigmatos_ZCMA.PRE.1
MQRPLLASTYPSMHDSSSGVVRATGGARATGPAGVRAALTKGHVQRPHDTVSSRSQPMMRSLLRH